MKTHVLYVGLVLAVVVLGPLGESRSLAQQPKELGTLRWPDFAGAMVAFAPDGKTLAVAHGAKVTLWDLPTRQVRVTIKPGFRVVRSVAFAPDGRTLAVGGGGGFNVKEPVPGGVGLWDMADGMERAFLIDLHGPVSPVAFSANGFMVVSGDWGLQGELKLWDAVTGKEMVTLRGHDGDIHAVAISPNGKVLASGSDRHELKLWDVSMSLFISGPGCGEWGRPSNGYTILRVLATAKERASFRGPKEGVPGGVRSLAFTPDGKTLVCGTLDGTVTLWDWAAGKAVRSWRDAEPLWTVAVSSDGRLLASGGGRKGGPGAGGDVKLWDLATGNELASLKWQGTQINSLAFSADGKMLAAGGGVAGKWEGQVQLWDVSGEPDDAEGKAAFRITKLGGRLIRDEKACGKPVIEVFVSS